MGSAGMKRRGRRRPPKVRSSARLPTAGSNYTFESNIEKLGQFASGSWRLRGWKRVAAVLVASWWAVGIVLVIAVVVVGSIVDWLV